MTALPRRGDDAFARVPSNLPQQIIESPVEGNCRLCDPQNGERLPSQPARHPGRACASAFCRGNRDFEASIMCIGLPFQSARSDCKGSDCTVALAIPIAELAGMLLRFRTQFRTVGLLKAAHP